MPLSLRAINMSRSAWCLISLSALVLLAATVFWPLHGAGFTGDDWVILARVIHDSGPLSLLFHDHSQTYLYRPTGMWLWWFSGKLFSSEPSWHYLLNVLLHFSNTTALFFLLRSCTARLSIALFACALFVVHPVAAATTSWLSDRFDLLATGLLLCMLLLLANAREGGPRLPLLTSLSVLSLLAMGSKETAIIMVPVVATWMLLITNRWQARTAVMGSIIIPVLMFLSLRRLILGTWGGGTLSHSPTGAAIDLLEGFSLWAKHAGAVILGAAGAVPGLIAMALGILLLASGLVLFTRFRRQLETRGMTMAATGTVTCLCVAVVQAPVTHIVLAAPNPFLITTNLRFYYLALAATLAVFAMLMEAWIRNRERAPRRGKVWQGLHISLPAFIATAISLAILMLTGVSQRATERWAKETGAPDRRQLQAAAAESVQTVNATSGCLIALYGTSRQMGEFPLFADSIVKAQLPVDSPLIDCIVVTERSPFFAFTSLSAGPAFRELPQRPTATGVPGPYASDGLLSWLPGEIDRCEWNRKGHITSFRWDGSRFIRLEPADDPMLKACPPTAES